MQTFTEQFCISEKTFALVSQMLFPAMVVLVPCCSCNFVSAAISGEVDISEVPWCHLLKQMSSQ